MKNFIYFLAVAFAILMVSCGGNANRPAADAVETEQIEVEVADNLVCPRCGECPCVNKHVCDENCPEDCPCKLCEKNCADCEACPCPCGRKHACNAECPEDCPRLRNCNKQRRGQQ